MRCAAIFLLVLLIVIPCSVFSQGIYEVYAVGEGSTMLKLEYGAWVPVDLSAITGCGTLLDIWGSSPEDIYVTGCGSELLHYDGSEWQKITIHDPETDYPPLHYTVDGTGPDNIYVGGDEWPTSNYRHGVAYHYDGIEWTCIGGLAGIDKLWADPGGGFYAIGQYFEYFDRQYYGTTYSYKNDTWSYASVPVGEDGQDQYYGIGGGGPELPFISGEWSVPMAGWGGSIFRKESSSWDVIGYDVPCGIYTKCPVWPVLWHGVWSESELDAWFVGENGRVLHWTPDGYTEYDTGVTETLRAIWKNPFGFIYAVGDNGKILYSDGNSWLEMASGTTENLKDIWGLFRLPVATLLQRFSTDIDMSGITIRWLLSEIDDDAGFRVKRSTDASAALVIDDGSNIERNGLSFKYVDSNVQTGNDYAYIVEYSNKGEWKMLFETGLLTVPRVSFALMPNFPNPFNPSTKITYLIPDQGHVSLKIYDVSGKLVRTILDDVQGPGEHSVFWNGLNDQGENVVSGTYFCRLISGKQAVTRKILLMR